MKTVTRIQRSYLKVQELFAKIGGIANVSLIIIKALSYFYLRFNYFLYVEETIRTNIEAQNEQGLNLSFNNKRNLNGNINSGIIPESNLRIGNLNNDPNSNFNDDVVNVDHSKYVLNKNSSKIKEEFQKVISFSGHPNQQNAINNSLYKKKIQLRRHDLFHYYCQK